MPKKPRKLKADAPQPGAYFNTTPRTEVFPGVGYEQDPQVHAPKAPETQAPEAAGKGFLKEEKEEISDDDLVLTQPLKYVVSPQDAIEKMESLNKKVVESRPDLAPEVAVVDQAIQNLEERSQGGGTAVPEQVEQAAPQFKEGDRVVVAMEDATYQAVVEGMNEDGTFNVKTDQAMSLKNVPATSMQIAEATAMTLPASLLKRLQAARMVTDAIAQAFLEGKKRRVANTSTDGQTIWLHNNAIARKSGDGSVEITLAGWPTATTRERLNGLLNALGVNKRVSQRAGSQMLDGKPWDGEWTNVGSPAAPEAAAPEAPAAPDLAADRRAMIDDEMVEEADLDDEGPSAEDYTITPAGELGSKYGVGQVEGDFLGEFVEWDDAAKAIRDKMEKEQFWPNVWFIDDHGGVEHADISASMVTVWASRVMGDTAISKGGKVRRFPGTGSIGEVVEELVPSDVPGQGEYGKFKVRWDQGEETENLGTELVNVFEGLPAAKVGDEVMYRGWAWNVDDVNGDQLELSMSGDPGVTEVAKQGEVQIMGKKIKAVAVAEKPATEAGAPAPAFSGTETGKIKEGYKPTGVQIVEEGGKPRAFDPNKDDVQPAELHINEAGKLALANPNGENSYEEGANDELEFKYWDAIRALAPQASAPAKPEIEPAKVEQKPAAEPAMAASVKAAAKAAREKLKAAKVVEPVVKASAFDEIPEIEIGGGYKARRKQTKNSGAGEDEETAEIEVIDADGKVKATYPDAFGDDTVVIIKFLRQVLDIKETDDKKAAKKEGGEGKAEGGESDIEKKPKALPKAESKEKDGEAGDLEAAARQYDEKTKNIRSIAERLLRAGHICASLDDVDQGLLNGMTLAAAQAAAAKIAVNHKVLDLLAQPKDELLLIQASLPHLESRKVTVQASESGLGPINLSASGVIDVSDAEKKMSIGAAFGSSFRR